MDENETRLAKFTHPKATATEWKAFLDAEYIHTELVSEFTNHYIAELKSYCQLSNARNMEYPLKYLLECFGPNIVLSAFNANLIKKRERKVARKNGLIHDQPNPPRQPRHIHRQPRQHTDTIIGLALYSATDSLKQPSATT